MGINSEAGLLFFSKLELSDTNKKLIDERIQEFADLNKLIQSMEIDPFVSIDFSIVRGLAYYTIVLKLLRPLERAEL